MALNGLANIDGVNRPVGEGGSEIEAEEKVRMEVFMIQKFISRWLRWIQW